MFRSYRDLVRTPVKTGKDASKKYYCDLCVDDNQDKVWDSEADVEIHRRRFHSVELSQLMKEPKNYMCTVCLRPQTDKASLIAHIKTDHLLSSRDSIRVKRELFICDYCNNIFFNKLLLIAHIKSFHLLSNAEKRTATTVCPFCHKTIKMRSIWFHFLYHDIFNTGTCPICLIPFDNYKDALKHTECHPGYYYCNICSYKTEREGLFVSHIEKHKKIVNLEGRDVRMISRFFVPNKRTSSWNKRVVNIFKGITLTLELQICVLCRTLCETKEQMLHHIYGDHSPENTIEIKKHMCVCGEEFFNRVLLKHHIFVMKGNHRDCEEKETTISTQPNTDLQEIMTHNQQTNTIMQDGEDKDIFGIVIEIQENDNISNCITVPGKLDSDIVSDAITFASQAEPQQNINYNTDCLESEISSQISTETQLQNDVHSENAIVVQTPNPIQSQHNMDIQLQHVLDNESQEEINKQSQNEISRQPNKKMNIQSHNDLDIRLNNEVHQLQKECSSQSYDKNNLELMELEAASEKLFTIESDNDIYQDEIILNANNKYKLKLQNTSKEMDIDSNRITIELVRDDKPKRHNTIQRLRKKDANQQNIVVLNNSLSEKFESSKQFYEHILDSDEESDLVESAEQFRYVLDPVQGQIHYMDAESLDTDVYEVVEMSGDQNEESGRIICEES